MDAYDICGWNKSIVFSPSLHLRGEALTHPSNGEARISFSTGCVRYAAMSRVSSDAGWFIVIPGETPRDPEHGKRYRSMRTALVALDRRYAKVRKRNLRATMEALDYDSRSSIIEHVPGLVGIVAKAVEQRLERAAAKQRKALAQMPKPLPPGRYDATGDTRFLPDGRIVIENFKVLGPSA